MLAAHPDTAGELVLLVDATAWQTTPGYGYIDVLLPADHPAPIDAIAAEMDLSYPLVADIARALNADIPTWDASTFDILAEGATFNRYFVPADYPTKSGASQVSTDIEARLEHLRDLTGEDLRWALHAIGDYSDRAPTQRVPFLDDVISEVQAP